jgi:hypothetical protein
VMLQEVELFFSFNFLAFFGYGTGWHWCYFFPLTVQSLANGFTLYGLRYRPSIWNAFTLVKAWTVMIILSIYIEILLPIPGFLTIKMVHFVPFRSPTWTLVYFYIIEWHLPCCIPWVVLTGGCSHSERASLLHGPLMDGLLCRFPSYCWQDMCALPALRAFYTSSDQHAECTDLDGFANQ